MQQLFTVCQRTKLLLYSSIKTKGKTYSADWVKVVKNSIATIAPHYTMKRQLDDYYTKFYNKQAERSANLHANNNRLAKEIALWKETVAERWDSIKRCIAQFRFAFQCCYWKNNYSYLHYRRTRFARCSWFGTRNT